MKFMQRFYDEQLSRLPSNFSYHSENKNRKVLVLFNNVLHSLSQKFIQNIDKVMEATSWLR